MNKHILVSPPTEYYYSVKKRNITMNWWLMPVTLATQEAEIRRISAQGQL
jgi:TfoX/Sxy family transcriptional regulator of competence genes